MNKAELKALPTLEEDIAILEQEEARLKAAQKSVPSELKRLRRSLQHLRKD